MEHKTYRESMLMEKPNIPFKAGTGPSLKHNLSKISEISCGTVIIRFRNFPKQGFMPLLSVANNQYPSSYFSIYIEHAQKIGVLKKTISKDGIRSNNLNIHKTLTVDPKYIHTIAFSSQPGHGYTLYFNGHRICFYPDEQAVLFSDISSMGKIDKGILGDFFESQKIPDKYYRFAGHIDFIHIHNIALKEKDLIAITGLTARPDDYINTPTREFLYFPGLNNSNNFRIPTLLRTSDNVLISSADQRERGHQDHSNVIKTIVRRSVDLGKTFSMPLTACRMFGRGQTIDSSIVEDTDNNRILLLNNSHSECMAPFDPGFGSGFYKKNGKLYHKMTAGSRTYYGDSTGNILNHQFEHTDYTYDQEYNLYKAGHYTGNLFDNDSPVKIYETTYTLLCYSDDKGKTWSAPRILNQMIKSDFMKSLNVSPGNGIQLKNGLYKGRICFPVYFYNKNNAASSALIYSDDHGETFTLGSSPNDGRQFQGKILSSETVSLNTEFLTECQAVEMPNGYIKLFIRNMNGHIAVATSRDGGMSFDDRVIFDENLSDPFCQCSVTSLPAKVDDKDAIAFCNPNSAGRTDGTIKIGLLDYDKKTDDYIISWKYSRLIKPGSFAYSCIAPIDRNTLGIVYEGTPSTHLSFEKFSINTLKTGNEVKQIKYDKMVIGNTLTISFKETVMLTGKCSVIVIHSTGEIITSLFDNNILTNTFIFKSDTPLPETDYHVGLSKDTELFDIYGIKHTL